MNKKDIVTLATLSIALQSEEICELLFDYDSAKVCIDCGPDGNQTQLVVEFYKNYFELTDNDFWDEGYTVLPLHINIPDNWSYEKVCKVAKRVDKYAQPFFKNLKQYL